VGLHVEGGGYPDLEMRNCPCGSTLTVERPAAQAAL